MQRVARCGPGGETSPSAFAGPLRHGREGLTPKEKSFGVANRPGHASSMSDYLETERLVLRQFTAQDADLLIELDSDPAVMRFLTGGEPSMPDDVVRDQVIPGLLAAYDRWDGRFGLFAAYERGTDAFIGWFCLRPERSGPLDEVELGYRLRRDAWGKGYATEGST